MLLREVEEEEEEEEEQEISGKWTSRRVWMK